MQKRHVARTRGIGVGVLAVFVALLGATAAQSGENATRTLNIGVISDMSGPTVATQAPWLEGLQTYIRMTNDAGGVRGTRINLIAKDEKYSAPVGLAALKDLITINRVPFVVGLNNSAVQVPALPILKQYKIGAGLGQSTETESLTPFNKYFFGTQCTYADQADVAMAWMQQLLKKPKSRVGTLGLSVPSGDSWGKLIEARVKKAGGTYVGHQSIAPTAVNADNQVREMAQQRPDWVAIHGSPVSTLNFLRAMDKYDLKVPAVGIFAATAESVYDAAPFDVAKNYYGVNCYTPSYNTKAPGAAELRRVAQKYGAKNWQNINYVTGWVAGMTFVAGLRNAPRLDAAGIVAGLEKVRNVNTRGLSPNVSFSTNCHKGVRGVRPYTYNFKKKQLQTLGTYEQWQRYITNEDVQPGTCGRPR